MNFPLRDIEQQVNESHLLHGEDLLAAGNIARLVELERHLWEAKVADSDQEYEVEVKITPSKLAAASCECQTFAEHRMCGHVVAVLLQLRRQRQQAKSSKPRSYQQNKKLTTGLVLNQIDPEELIDFVRQYAKTNRNFSIALKARFAATVSNMRSDEKYKQVLESAISASRKSDRSITQRGAQKIIKVLKELLQTANKAVVERDFVEGFIIARSIIERVGPIFKKVTSEKVRLEPQLERAFRLIDQIIIQQPAPALLEQIWDYCYAEPQKLIYRSAGLDLEFLQFLHRLADESAKQDQLIALTNELLAKYEKEHRNKTSILLFQYKVLREAKQEAQAQALIEAHLKEPEILLFAIEQARQHGRLEQARQLALTGLSMKPTSAVVDQLDEILLKIARHNKDQAGIIQFAEKRLLRSLQAGYFSLINTTRPKNWKTYVDGLLKKIQKMPFSKEKLDLIGHILLTQDRFDALEQHLSQSLSVDLLLKYGPKIKSIGQARLYELYQKLLHYYLRNHVGRKPSIKIRTAISQLHDFGLSDLADQLVEEFRNDYAERHSLMEELNFF
ncbi:MAG: SWIM zinc finger family protein [Bacteroidota bacterium]